MIDLKIIFIWGVSFIYMYIVIFWLIVLFDKGIKPKKEKLKSFPLVTIAIPAYNEEKTIEKTLKSALGLDYPKDKMEIIVVNDGSKDNTRNIVLNFIKKHKDYNIILINQKNSGKGSAMNNALSRSKGEFFISLDSDSFIKKNALRVMLPKFEDKKVASVLPLMKVYNPRNFIERIQWVEYLINVFYKLILTSLNCIHVTPGPFPIYRTEILRKIGGYDEKNLTEDMEICLRLQKHNYKIVQSMDTTVYTISPDTFGKLYKQRNRWYKGTLLNLYRYKWLIGNRNYGDFGVFQMPTVLISGFLTVVAFSFVFYNFIISPLLRKIYDLYSVDFNLIVDFSNVNKLTFLGLNYTNMFFALVSFILVVLILFLAYKYTKEKIFSRHFLAIPLYVILYSGIIAIMWIGVYFDLIFRRMQKL